MRLSEGEKSSMGKQPSTDSEMLKFLEPQDSVDSFGLPRAEKPKVGRLESKASEESKSSSNRNIPPAFKRSTTSIMIKGINSVCVQSDEP